MPISAQPISPLMAEERLMLRDQLAEHSPWSPHDFIRGISAAADKAMYAEQLTRELDPAQDLRCVYRSADQAVVFFAELLPWDTDFFGYTVARLNAIFPLTPPFDCPQADYALAVRSFTEHLRAHGIRYLFTSVDPRDLASIRALCQAGFDLIETRAYYHINLRSYEYAHRFACRAATPEDIPSLGKAAQVMVNAYDRFHADPFISRESADRLMYKWVEQSISGGFADITLVPDAPQPTAFCTVRYHKSEWERWNLKLAQPILSAVSPEFQGWYLKLISEINYHLKDEIGAEQAYLITQVTNRAVIRVWEKLGYTFGKAEHVFRIVL